MEDLNVCGAEALVPADHSADTLGELAADCCLVPGHAGDHFNGMARWAAEEASRADLILGLMEGLCTEDAELLRSMLRLAELARPEADDVQLLEDALVSLDGLFAAVDAA
ncbi:hypothetical protein [Streptomyces chiangmaiensis]|uniref:Uncharacterized protein n=1 Tax=Streptomyces chiangmaiensis TaxID=766497 RepID=A0ABU7FLH3_9ACTN|nr:hypothetical protein [Streptomyces chiangmaiensis]MED7824966.1 hypothetical protein [Streptomyces chiangmaiensis]